MIKKLNIQYHYFSEAIYVWYAHLTSILAYTHACINNIISVLKAVCV